MYLVLLTFRDRRFAHSQIYVLLNSMLISGIKCVQFCPERYTVVSSAKDSKLNLFDFPMSFIYIGNNIGHMMDPWGMPHLISNRSD